MTEVEQELGREGAKRFRRLLDGTMRFQMPYDVYEAPERVVLPLLPDGEKKTFDLKGFHSDDEGQPGPEVFVEAKNYKGAGGQSTAFKEFLAVAYSATLRLRQDLGIDPQHEFMWATTCPWKGDGFRDVATTERVREAIEDADEKIIPSDHEIDHDMVSALAKRFWVWVVSDRHEEMILEPKMREVVAAKRAGG